MDEPPKKPRIQTANDRDAAARRRAPAEGYPVYVEGEVTGVLSGEELENARARRPTPLRLQNLEAKADTQAREHSELLKSHLKLVETVGELAGDVGEVVGQLRTLPDLVNEIRESNKAQREREAARENEAADIRKNRRKRITSAISAATSGGLLIEILHRFGVL